MPTLTSNERNGNDVEFSGRRAPASVELPERLRQYGTPQEMGTGATSIVYKMIPPVRLVTKVIDCGSDASLLRSALYELRVMRRLAGCSSAVQLEDAEVVARDGSYAVYLVEEYCTSLVEAMTTRSFTAAECVELALGVTAALIACRDAGVLHLDVQPKNIFLSQDGQVRLGDFGHSLLVEDKDDRSRLRGTLAYMAPEVFRDRFYGERSDIYSVGIMLYCLLNGGRYPFAEECPVSEAAYRLLAGARLPRIMRLGARQGEAIDEALGHLCAFDLAKRPASFEELETVLLGLKGRLEGMEGADKPAVDISGRSENVWPTSERSLPALGDTLESRAQEPQAPILPANMLGEPRRLPRKVLPVIFAVDVSGSMTRMGMGMTSLFMDRALDILRGVERKSDKDVRVGIVSFSTGVEWNTLDEVGNPALVALGKASWVSDGYPKPTGLTYIGKLLGELNERMTRSFLFPEYVGCTPIVIFVGDGKSTDDWHDQLERVLAENAWFRNSIRLCASIGEDADIEALASLAGGSGGRKNYEAVFRAIDADTLGHLIRPVSVTASTVASSDAGEGRGSISDDAGPFGARVPGNPRQEPELIPDSSDWTFEPFGATDGGTWDDCWDSWGDGADHGSSQASPTQPAPSLQGAESCSPGPHPVFGTFFDADPVATSIAANSMDNGVRSHSDTPWPDAKNPGERADFRVPTPPIELERVRFSVVAPQRMEHDDFSTIDIYLYEQAFRDIVDQVKNEAFTLVQEKPGGFLSVGENSSVKVVLSSAYAEIEDGEQELTWLGGFLVFSFGVYVPKTNARKTIPFKALVYVDGIQVSHLSFFVLCDSPERQQPEIIRNDVHSAFISYSSEDRDRVISLIQGMKAARQDLDIFFDVQSLRVGEDWKPALMREVENRDVLYLCWSRAARASEYVDLEWRHALETKGIDYIEPIPLEPPSVCPPPEELKGKHFNDILLFLLGK